MEFVQSVLAGVFNPAVLMYIMLGVAGGICIGALPGLTATMGVALLLPLTFGMDAQTGILLLLGIYIGAIYGGSISAILLKTPGTPASAATALDGYEFSKRGEGGRALGIATVSSFVGGVVSCIALMLISPQLAKLALKFSSAEFFLLAVFGLTIIASISGNKISKGLICGFIGMLIATVGIDSITGKVRYTFGSVSLMSGVSYIPVMIGLFAMSQAFISIEDIWTKEEVDNKVTKVIPSKEDLKKILKTAPLTGLIGTFIGIIPGAGADIGAFVSYNTAKNMSKTPEKFGTGITEAIAASEGGNNGVTGGAMIPMLTLGIPGDAVAAIMIGALTIQGLNPGPLLFQNDKVLVYTIFVGLLVANCCMLLLGLSCLKAFTKVLTIPKTILTPIIFVLCIVGSYAIKNDFFDVGVMLVFGIIGYFMQKAEIPASPAILGLILGPMAEKHFRTALLKSGGNYGIFFSSAICWLFILLAVGTLVLPIVKSMIAKSKAKKAAQSSSL
ncbi:MAG: tripartite tricarboxylate transporter permease [Clostridium sp.]|uniref:tripartite tricarboxylate transporter permease n=1 Tax=Clostridium culturomicium TaxID=1499683 RepID=UPI00058CB3EC|nr:tripartite tricarboxylate transporter permease [Clostridium culturomicium]MDU4889304.1 tripartite tricarboxylate transporter permease [Clostridium sp.]MDU7083053.1 tripartite tricarboxylate transporter permease [Clostridium sp.]